MEGKSPVYYVNPIVLKAQICTHVAEPQAASRQADRQQSKAALRENAFRNPLFVPRQNP